MLALSKVESTNAYVRVRDNRIMDGLKALQRGSDLRRAARKASSQSYPSGHAIALLSARNEEGTSAQDVHCLSFISCATAR